MNEPKATQRGGKAPHSGRKTDASDPATSIDGISTVEIPGTNFLELQGRYPPGSLEDLKLRFTRRVIFIARRWRNHINEELRATGQSHARWITLLWVHLIGGKANHRELAERIGVELPTLIRLLNSLEAEGLLKRAALPGPGRSKTVQLTESGRAVLVELNAIAEHARKDFLKGADLEKLQVAMSLFDDLLSSDGKF